jgi:hypothetical protein
MPKVSISIPLSAISLAPEGGSDKTTAPEPGDDVSFTVTGKVAQVTGGQAEVYVETANGEPVTGGEDGEPTAEDEAAEFERMAATEDENPEGL